jgi:apyrase
MDPIKLQIRPTSRSNLFARNSNSKYNKSNLLIFALISISFALLLCYLVVFGKSSRSSAKRKYGIVIDGGSTGTRIHVFEYRVENGSPVYDFGPDGLATMRVNPGLSAFAEDPDGAGGSLTELLEFGKGRVPRGRWGETEVRLMATAGLRLLESDLQQRILDSCRQVLRSSGFKFRDEWASIITGMPFWLSCIVLASCAVSLCGSCFACDFVRDNGESLRM